MNLLNKLRKLKKRKLLALLGVLYLSILSIFGIVYWRIANISSGQFFVFQNDINLNTKVSIFKREMNINAFSKEFNSLIIDLMCSEEYKRPIIRLSNPLGKRENFFVFDNTLGELWANYYCFYIAEKGITHMKVDSVSEEILNGKFNTYKINLSFYNLKGVEGEYSKYRLYKKESAKGQKENYHCTVWVREYPLIKEELFNQEYTYYPINLYFTRIMENSISFLDDSPFVLKTIVNGSFKYPLWNFLYFSTVTITTLGYGDILPNSTLVRILVMVETVVGVVILGMFISCLFWDEK